MITIQELADLLGLNYQTIKYRMKKLKIKAQQPGKTVTNEQAKRIGEFKDGRKAE